MSNSREKGVMILGTVDLVNLNSAAFTALYTGRPGQTFIVDHVKLRKLSANATNLVATFGKSTSASDFVAARTFSNLSAAGKSCKIEPVPATTPAAITEYVAGDIFGITVTTPAGIACTATFDVFGHVKPT